MVNSTRSKGSHKIAFKIKVIHGELQGQPGACPEPACRPTGPRVPRELSRGLGDASAGCTTPRAESLRPTMRRKGEESLILLDGRHEFPFSFQLPQEPLVTSFTGKYGSIQYYVKAILERPAAPDQSVQTELQVISHIDVNSPALLTPVLRSQEKMVGCWFFTSGPVSLSAKIERKGYCNGEAIPIYAEIENCSSRLIVPKAAIFQTQTYLASGKTKTFRQMVANVRGNHIASGSTDTWNGKTLKIPPVSPSILDCCIIRVEYSLAVTFGGCFYRTYRKDEMLAGSFA
nr:PREDICTED: arrestin domain-containing protein 4-like [Apteryx mantelli mantelli]